MTLVTTDMTISPDGFVAGPNVFGPGRGASLLR